MLALPMLLMTRSTSSSAAWTAAARASLLVVPLSALTAPQA